MNENINLSAELVSLKKSILSNNRDAIQKYLSQIKNLSQEFLNLTLFWSIENYKVQEQTDQCLHILLKYTGQNAKTKANPNCQINGQSPLIAACKKGQLSLVKRLIENGAKPDHLTTQNKHPLQFLLLSRLQNYDVGEYLISQMQTVNILIKPNQKCPLIICVQKEFGRIFKSLVQKGAQLQFQTFNILHIIFKQKFKNIKKKKKFLKQLISKHILFTQLDSDGKIPIDYQDNQQIKAYYHQNFKIKQKVIQIVSPVQKINNNSSIFINQKPTKKDNKLINYEKRKSIYQSNNALNGKSKQSIKEQNKYQQKQIKDQDISFEDDLQYKSQNQAQQDTKLPQKIINKTISSFAPKKVIKQNPSSNINLNSSFISTSNASNKYKSIKSNNAIIKTAVNQKSTPNKKLTQSRKVNTSSNFGSKKKSFEQQNIKIDLIKDLSQTKKNVQNFDKNNFSNKNQTNFNKKSYQQQQQYQNQNFQAENQPLQAIKIHKISQSVILQVERQQITIQKSITQKLIEQCQKIIGQMVIKDDQQTTNLKQLKVKFNKVFTQYQQSSEYYKKVKQSQHYKNAKQSQQSNKLKQVKLVTNHQIKPITSKHITTPALTTKKSCLLWQQIIQISQKISKNSQVFIPSINKALNLLSKNIQLSLQSTRKEQINLNVQIYGSRATGLQIENSDIDLLIVCNINAGVKQLMGQLQNSNLFNTKQFEQVKFLTNTSMPIVKLKLSQQFSNLNVDLTFQVRGHTGIRCTALIHQFIAAEPLLKPLVSCLKTLLNCYDLCDTYTGGLGSYSLTLMTIALLQFTQINKTKQNLGQIFLQFLLFYGFQLDYICQAIIIHPPGFNQRPAFSIYQLPYSLDLSPKLIIYDPLNPVNNVGRATYRIVQLKKLFKIWYVKLKTQFYGAKNGIQQLMKLKKQLYLSTLGSQTSQI